MNEPLPPEVFCQQVPSVAEYVTAFRAIELEMGEHHFRMLRAHYHAMDHTVTASEMARAMRYASYSSANLHYGKLGRKLAEALGFRLKYWVNSLADFIGPDEGLPHWLWIMWPQVGAALEELGWISTDQDESGLEESP